MLNVECGVWNGCAERNVECGMVARSAMWNVECGMWNGRQSDEECLNEE